MSLRRPPRACIVAGCPNTTTGARCPDHEAAHQRVRNAERSQYAGGWRRQSQEAIAAHRATFGDVCPGWGRPAHPIDPSQWSTDHELGPLCIGCNSRKGATVDKERRR